MIALDPGRMSAIWLFLIRCIIISHIVICLFHNIEFIRNFWFIIYPFIVYLVTGMIPWFFFSDAFASTTVVFREYTYLVKKVVFNIRILPTSKILSNLYTHLFFILIGIAFALINGIYPLATSLQLIYYLFLYFLLYKILYNVSILQKMLDNFNKPKKAATVVSASLVFCAYQ